MLLLPHRPEDLLRRSWSGRTADFTTRWGAKLPREARVFGCSSVTLSGVCSCVCTGGWARGSVRPTTWWSMWVSQQRGLWTLLLKWTLHSCFLKHESEARSAVVMFLSNTFWFTCLHNKNHIGSVCLSDMLLLDLAPPSLILGCAYFLPPPCRLS